MKIREKNVVSMKVGDNTDLRQACKCSMKKIGDNSDLRQSHLLYHALLPVVGVITDHPPHYTTGTIT